MNSICYILAVAIFISPILGKTGLQKNYGFISLYAMTAYIVCYFVIGIILEFMVKRSSKFRTVLIDGNEPPQIQMKELSGPLLEEPKELKKSSYKFRLILIGFFIFIVLILCTYLAILIAKVPH